MDETIKPAFPLPTPEECRKLADELQGQEVFTKKSQDDLGLIINRIPPTEDALGVAAAVGMLRGIAEHLEKRRG